VHRRAFSRIVMPREMRGIQYAAALRFITDVSEYWIIRIRG
jgi:ABC-type spermidine/putrescine transport system permease subunit I